MRKTMPSNAKINSNTNPPPLKPSNKANTNDNSRMSMPGNSKPPFSSPKFKKNKQRKNKHNSKITLHDPSQTQSHSVQNRFGKEDRLDIGSKAASTNIRNGNGGLKTNARNGNSNSNPKKNKGLHGTLSTSVPNEDRNVNVNASVKMNPTSHPNRDGTEKHPRQNANASMTPDTMSSTERNIEIEKGGTRSKSQFHSSTNNNINTKSNKTMAALTNSGTVLSHDAAPPNVNRKKGKPSSFAAAAAAHVASMDETSRKESKSAPASTSSSARHGRKKNSVYRRRGHYKKDSKNKVYTDTSTNSNQSSLAPDHAAAAGRNKPSTTSNAKGKTSPTQVQDFDTTKPHAGKVPEIPNFDVPSKDATDKNATERNLALETMTMMEPKDTVTPPTTPSSPSTVPEGYEEANSMEVNQSSTEHSCLLEEFAAVTLQDKEDGNGVGGGYENDGSNVNVVPVDVDSGANVNLEQQGYMDYPPVYYPPGYYPQMQQPFSQMYMNPCMQQPQPQPQYQPDGSMAMTMGYQMYPGAVQYCPQAPAACFQNLQGNGSPQNEEEMYNHDSFQDPNGSGIPLDNRAEGYVNEYPVQGQILTGYADAVKGQIRNEARTGYAKVVDEGELNYIEAHNSPQGEMVPTVCTEVGAMASTNEQSQVHAETFAVPPPCPPVYYPVNIQPLAEPDMVVTSVSHDAMFPQSSIKYDGRVGADGATYFSVRPKGQNGKKTKTGKKKLNRNHGKNVKKSK